MNPQRTNQVGEPASHSEMYHLSSVQHDSDQKIFKDGSLSSEEISQLLGVRVMVPSGSTERIERYEAETRSKRIVLLFAVSITAMVVALASIFGGMYQLGIGPFYNPASAATSAQ